MAMNPDKSSFLLKINDKGMWELNEETLNFLNSLKTEIFVTSSVGKYRTGKSSLLNRIAGKRSAFATGSTTDPVTKGILALPVMNPKLPNVCHLLLDTEGLNNTDTDRNLHDTHVFVYSLLLSHVVMFNAEGAIDRNMLDQLDFMSELSNHINVDGKIKVPPSLFFVLRNWYLEMRVKNREATPDEYFEDRLTSSSSSQNTPAEYLRELFPSRRCFALPKPVEEEKLRYLDSLPDTDLKPLFLQRVDEILKALHDEAVKPDNLNNRFTGQGFVFLLRECVEAINSSKVLCVDSTFNLMAEVECGRAMTEILSILDGFENKIRADMPLSKSELDQRLANFKANTEEAFRNKVAFKKGICFNNTFKKLTKIIDTKFETLENYNMKFSEMNQKVKSLETDLVITGVGAILAGGAAFYSRSLRVAAEAAAKRSAAIAAAKAVDNAVMVLRGVSNIMAEMAKKGF